jgi:type VI secretion system secreted protein Hcp
MKKWVIVLFLKTAVFTQAYAQGNIYMKLEGLDGPVTQKGFERYIELTGLNENIGNIIAKTGAGAASSKVLFDDFKVKKEVDKTSPKLRVTLVSGKHMPQAIITYKGYNETDFFTITLTDVSIKNISTTTECKPGCIISEELSLVFEKIKWEFRDAKSGIIQGGYDLKLGKTFLAP